MVKKNDKQFKIKLKDIYINRVNNREEIVKLIKTIGILIFYVILAGGIVKLNAQPDTKIQLQMKLDSLTNNKIIPGATLSVLLKDGKNISLASGFDDIENNKKMKPGTKMFSGSVGKTYVAAIVLKLQELGKIDINRKVKEYLSNEIWFAKIPNADKMTIKMLLNHTAGVPEYVYNKTIWEKFKETPDRVMTVEERMSYIYNQKPENEAGKGWKYADSHYIILGALIEKVTGKDYYTVLDEMIIKPYKFKNTIPANKRLLPGIAAGYTGLQKEMLLPEKVYEKEKYVFNPQGEWTGGGLINSVDDLTEWFKILFTGDLLSGESKKLMITPAPFETTLFENAGYGLGCFIGKTNGVTYYGHTGFAPGYRTYVQYLPECDIAIALQINTDNPKNNFSIKDLFNRLKEIIVE